MRWPRTKNCSAPEHLTPSECRRVTGTTLDAEYLSVGLQVRCSVRCSSRCCCCPYFAAHTTHPRVTATAHDLRPPFTPSRVCRRAQISQLQSRSSSIRRSSADAAGGDVSGCCRGWRGRASGRAGAAPSPASRVLRCAQMRPRRWAGSPRGAGGSLNIGVVGRNVSGFVPNYGQAEDFRFRIGTHRQLIPPAKSR